MRTPTSCKSVKGSPFTSTQAKGWWGVRLWERCVARPICGEPLPEAEWVTVGEHARLRFIQRHGVLFEDNRGEAGRPWLDKMMG